MCDDFSELLSAYADDEVTLSERLRVETHLAGCAGCRAELKAWREAAHFATLLPELLPPADLRMKILSRTVYRKSAWARLRDAVAQPSVWRPALAATGAAGLAGIAIYAMLSGPSQPTVATNPKPKPIGSHDSGVRVIPPVVAPPVAPPEAVATLPDKPKDGLKEKMKHLFKDVQKVFTPDSAETDDPIALLPPDAGSDKLLKAPVHTASWPAKPRKAFIATPTPKTTPKTSTPKSAAKPTKSGVPPVKSGRPQPKANPSQTSDPSFEGMPMPDRPMVAAGMPSGDTEQAVNTSIPPAEDEPKREVHTDNPIVEGLKMLASVKPEKKEDPTQEMVKNLNATLNASALSTARQVKWDIGKIKF